MSAARAHANGMFPWENQIIDLWDSGVTAEFIAVQLGRDVGAVRKIISRYNVTGHNPEHAMIRCGSASLLTALHRFHPETRRGCHP